MILDNAILDIRVQNKLFNSYNVNSMILNDLSQFSINDNSLSVFKTLEVLMQIQMNFCYI